MKIQLLGAVIILATYSSWAEAGSQAGGPELQCHSAQTQLDPSTCFSHSNYSMTENDIERLPATAAGPMKEQKPENRSLQLQNIQRANLPPPL